MDVEPTAKQAIGDRCGVYLGWRDSCNGCTDPPTKWGRASTNACSAGVGAQNTCTTPSLGGDTVQLLGVNLDGDTDGNDKLYGGMACAAADEQVGVAPCPPGQAITGRYGSSWTCGAVGGAVIDYIGQSCSLYLGWQDACDACTTAPAKWGFAGGTCMNGAGADNTCSVATLGGAQVNLFGLNPDGDVDGNDKLHVGLRCAPAPTEEATATGSCPANHFVAGTNADGSLRCEGVAAIAERYFAERCTVYLGWRDACEGCTQPPAKWGQVRVGACTNGVGADSTCAKHMLGSESVDMFGLNFDGDVDGNDTLYVGFQCR